MPLVVTLLPEQFGWAWEIFIGGLDGQVALFFSSRYFA